MELLDHDATHSNVLPPVASRWSIPYYGYARQDRKVRPRVPITAKLVRRPHPDGRRRPDPVHGSALRSDPRLLQYPGGQPVFHAAHARRDRAPHRLRRYGRSLQMLAGPSEREPTRRSLGANLAIIDKRREVANVAEVMKYHWRRERADLHHRRRYGRYGRYTLRGRSKPDGRRERLPSMQPSHIRFFRGPAIKRISESRLDRGNRDRYHPPPPRCGGYGQTSTSFLSPLRSARRFGESITRRASARSSRTTNIPD